MPRWIILEDDTVLRQLVAAMCQIWEVEPIELADGFAAAGWLELLNSGAYHGEIPELALLDIRMPGPQGDEIARMIRQTPKLERMAIVMMTAFVLNPREEADLMERTQADLVLRKPLPALFEFNRLLRDAITRRNALVDASKHAPAEEVATPVNGPAHAADVHPATVQPTVLASSAAVPPPAEDKPPMENPPPAEVRPPAEKPAHLIETRLFVPDLPDESAAASAPPTPPATDPPPGPAGSTQA
ncbi:MAG: response regulator [Anaerolineae bacterium]|nr:response regulator [Anaerolineae bacterium]